MEAGIVYSEPRCDMLRNAGYPGVPSAAEVRASIERSDPLALYQRLAMSDQIESRQRIHSSHLAPLAAAADEAVTVDRGDLAACQVAESPFPAGEDSAAMEHGYIIYPTDWVSTSDGRQWTMPRDIPSMRIPPDLRWTYAELDAEVERVRRLARWQEQR